MDESRSFDVYDDIPQVDHAAARRSRRGLCLWRPTPSAPRGRHAPRIALDRDDLTGGGTGAFAQDDGSPRWLERASITRANQPDWVTPLITASANLEEALIYDILRKIPTNGIPLVTAGSNRGIQFVPFGAFQITFATTPYQFHNDTRPNSPLSIAWPAATSSIKTSPSPLPPA